MRGPLAWRRPRHENTATVALPLAPPPAPNRMTLLTEWDVLRRAYVEDHITEAQKARFHTLTATLWPPMPRNPMNGIRRVPGGHGFPIPDQAGGDAMTPPHRGGVD